MFCKVCIANIKSRATSFNAEKPEGTVRAFADNMS